jgi:hypothetical protein
VDTAFGTEGFTFSKFGAENCDEERPDARRMAPRAGGGWVVAGAAGCGTGLAAFTATGAIDESFGQGGRVTVDLDPGRGLETMTGLTPLADGKFAGVQTRSRSSTPKRPLALVVARWHADGTLDRSFGKNGRVLLTRRGLNGYDVEFSGGIIPRAGGGLLVTADVHDPSDGGKRKLAAIALTRKGRLDRGFGAGFRRIPAR